jgi:hypothetical protein
MKKTRKPGLDEDMRPEYDFSKGVRGFHSRRRAAGSRIVILDPDVAQIFPTNQAVNSALRILGEIARRSIRRVPTR